LGADERSKAARTVVVLLLANKLDGGVGGSALSRRKGRARVLGHVGEVPGMKLDMELAERGR
jgi:hypothetical protein